MNKDNGLTLLSLIEKMRECRKKQRAFNNQKNTENYKAMLAVQEETDAMLSEVRKHIAAHPELNIKVLP